MRMITRNELVSCFFLWMQAIIFHSTDERYGIVQVQQQRGAIVIPVSFTWTRLMYFGAYHVHVLPFFSSAFNGSAACALLFENSNRKKTLEYSQALVKCAISGDCHSIHSIKFKSNNLLLNQLMSNMYIVYVRIFYRTDVLLAQCRSQNFRHL